MAIGSFNYLSFVVEEYYKKETTRIQKRDKVIRQRENDKIAVVRFTS